MTADNKIIFGAILVLIGLIFSIHEHDDPPPRVENLNYTSLGVQGSEAIRISGLLPDSNGEYRRPDNPNDVQVHLTTKDGKKWRAVWLEQCISGVFWKESHREGEILLDYDLTNPGKNVYVAHRAIKRGELIRARDIGSRGYAPPLLANSPIPEGLRWYLSQACD